MGEKRIFPVESLRILSSPLEIPAEHKADTSGVPFLTGSRISIHGMPHNGITDTSCPLFFTRHTVRRVYLTLISH